MLKTIIERLREPLPNPVNIADGISLIHRANRERKAAAVELEKLQKLIRCLRCGGAGELEIGLNTVVCPTCRGSGCEEAL